MDLKDIVSIAGKGGLFKVVKPSRNGLIIESVDEKKIRTSITASQRPSILKEISVYTNDAQKSVALSDLFIKMKKEFDPMPVDTKSSSAELMDFMSQLLPDYDQEKVYPSDVKKIINWYQIIQIHLPEVIEHLLNPPEVTAEETVENETEPKTHKEAISITTVVEEEKKKPSRKKAIEKEIVTEDKKVETKSTSKKKTDEKKEEVKDAEDSTTQKPSKKK